MVSVRPSQVKDALARLISELHGLRPPSRRLRFSCHARCAEREGHAQPRRQQRAGTQHGCALLLSAAARRPLAQLYPAAQKEGRWWAPTCLNTWLLKDIVNKQPHPRHAAQTKLAGSAHLLCGWLRQLSPMAGRFSCRRSSLPPTMWFVSSTTAGGSRRREDMC